jgi:hypothetical protein
MEKERRKIVTPAQTAFERACLRPAWRGRRHFHKADCLPILSLFNKASVCVFGELKTEKVRDRRDHNFLSELNIPAVLNYLYSVATHDRHTPTSLN